MEDILSLDFDGIISDEVENVRVETIRPSEKNSHFYNPAREDRVIELAKLLRRHGQLEPIVVSNDNVIVSGHTRYKAKLHLNGKLIKIRRADVWEDEPEFVKLLLAFNSTRDKTKQEKMREVTANIDPEVYIRQVEAKRLGDDDDDNIDLEKVQGSLKANRSLRSDNYKELQEAVIDFLERMKPYRPMTLRHIHYDLLNTAPLVSKKTGRNYGNNQGDYKILSDVVTKMRINGFIPFEWMTDHERKFVTNRGYESVSYYIEAECNRVLNTYRRDLQASQERHFVIPFEKRTIEKIVQRAVYPYGIPTLYCKGGASIDARFNLLRDWDLNGRKPLTLLFLTDLDPAGFRIQDTFVGSLEEDFCDNPHVECGLTSSDVRKMESYRIGITTDQIEKHQLVTTVDAKKTDKQYKEYVERTGLTEAYELESMPPPKLQDEIKQAIERVLDREAYEQECRNLRDDARFLAPKREEVIRAIRDD